jgi:hypothetical protein
MSTVAKILIGCAVIVLPFTASAQDDAKYCQALSKTYRLTAVSSSPNTVVPVAMAQCDQGDTVAAIPVLEKALHDSGVGLPPRT